MPNISISQGQPTANNIVKSRIVKFSIFALASIPIGLAFKAADIAKDYEDAKRHVIECDFSNGTTLTVPIGNSSDLSAPVREMMEKGFRSGECIRHAPGP